MKALSIKLPLHIFSKIRYKAVPSLKYRYCNHHHELDRHHKKIDLGDGEFIANKEAIPLLKALNKLGLKTRTHHISYKSDYAFVSILLDNAEIEIKNVNEVNADRDKYNGKTEVLISWRMPRR
jgi:hypothetical protein